MKWVYGAILALLLACTTTPEPAMAPPTTVVVPGCQATQDIGEACLQDCECLSPLGCVNQRCSLTKLADGQPCSDNDQCLSGYCTQTGHCGGPDQESLDCNYICREDYPSTAEKCYTVCR